MAFFYPRKQTVIIFLVCSITVISVAYYASSQQTEAVSEQRSASTALADVSAVTTSPIIDDPRLANWQQQFEGIVQTPAPKASVVADQKLTETDNLSRDFFTHYVELKQDGLLSNADIVDQTTQDLVTSHVDSSPTKTYTTKDLHMTNALDKISVQNFSAAVSRVMDSFTPTISESTIVQSYLSSNDGSVLKQIDPIIAVYKRMIYAFINIPTPQSISTQYLELVNAVYTLEFAAVDLRASDTDSVRGLAGVSARANGQMALITALTDLHTAIIATGADFQFNQNVLNVLLK